MAENGANGKSASKLITALLGAVIALQSVFIGLLISHIQDRSIHSDTQAVSLDAYRADREHFQCSLEEIKATLRDIQRRLDKTNVTRQRSFPRKRESSLFALDYGSLQLCSGQASPE